jgi:(2S)-methylsuccinyl-CoA dehydrogenase
MSADVLTQLENAATAAEGYAEAAKAAVRPLVSVGGKLDRVALDREQHLVHGLAWVSTYAETLRQVRDWAGALSERGAFGETEQLLARLLAAEYSAQLAGGVPMTQVEIIRPADFGVEPPAVALRITQADKQRLAALLHDAQGRATFENPNLDADMEMIRDQFRAFADDKIVPYAHGWHCNDELIPIEILNEMGANSASSALRFLKNSAGSGSARSLWFWCPKNCRAPGSASAPSAPAPRSPQS